jgi:amino-acid N-acetyltransferase
MTIAEGAGYHDEIAALLEAASLPHEHIDAHLSDFLVALDGARVVGAVGLERVGAAGLLRSLVVSAEQRGRGLGSDLYEGIVERARRIGLGELYLMTTTAEEFFARRGFVRIDRATAEPTLKDTREFRDLCPASAVVMRLLLDGAR